MTDYLGTGYGPKPITTQAALEPPPLLTPPDVVTITDEDGSTTHLTIERMPA